MKELYKQLIAQLSTIPNLRYIDLNFGQLQEEKPPLAYPAVLISMNAETIDDAQDHLQVVQGIFELTVICKMSGETNSNAPAQVREKALEYLDLCETIYEKLQGFSEAGFSAFVRRSVREQNIRKGLKTAVMSWQTTWHHSS